MTKVFYTAQHRPTADIQPVFELRNQQFFSTAHHPQYSHINQTLLSNKQTKISTNTNYKKVFMKPIFLAISTFFVFALSACANLQTAKSQCDHIQPLNKDLKNGFYLVTQETQNNETSMQQLAEEASITLNNIKETSVSIENTRADLNIRLTPSAGIKMHQISKDNIRQSMALALQGEVLISALIQSPLNENFRITFNSISEAEKYRNIINCYIQ